MSQFIDHVFIEVRSGDGGNGMVAWRREKYEPMGGPAGGNGGRGAHVYFEATHDLNTLIDFRFRKEFLADNGARGRSKGMHGKNAKDLVIRVPVGTIIKDAESGDVIADLVRPGQQAMVAQGGKGGLGNVMLASHSRKAPHYCEPGQPGIERKLELELKTIADVGLVGLPNAGKSTLLSVVSAAKPKIAAYPFSTLEPQLGVVRTESENSFVVADIPGLVEGASNGVGLGHDFLRHIERTKLLIHLVDVSSETVDNDVEVIEKELNLYNEKLANAHKILVLNKIDLLLPEEFEAIAERLKKKSEIEYQSPVKMISAATRYGVDELIKTLEQRLSEIKLAQPEAEEPVFLDPKATERIDTGFTIQRKKKVFFVEGDRVARLVSVTNMRDPDSLHHMYAVLRAMGVIEALVHEGAHSGSEVYAGDVSFVFGEEFS